MTKFVDVLNLEWSSFPSRDREAASLVCNYLKHMGATVECRSMFQGLSEIDRLKPRLVFMTNSIGAKLNIDVMAYAKSKGIYGVSGVAEGNFTADWIDVFTWGNNSSQVLMEDCWLLWSERTRNMVLQEYPQLAARTAIAGAPGFDKYLIAHGETALREQFPKIGGYNKIIGLGLWDFGITSPEDSRYQAHLSMFTPEQMSFFREDQKLFNAELLKLIESNTQVLFILKQHPGCQTGYWGSGIEGCEQLENVLIIKSEASITDCIQACDLWITYESTTALEAWLSGVATGLLNPQGIDFVGRQNYHEAQPNFPTADAWQAAIDAFYSTCELPGFQDLADKRIEIIEEQIQWADGLNHVRFGNCILDLLVSDAKPVALPSEAGIEIPGNIDRLKKRAMWDASQYLKGVHPRFRRFWDDIRSKWSDEELNAYNRKLMMAQTKLYEDSGLSRDDLREYKALN